MITALVLAAGRSRRMGVQKLLLPLAGQPMIARVVDQVLRSPVDEVLVVTGPDTAAIAQALTGRRVRFVANADTQAEMLSSVRCGLAALRQSCDGVLVVLGDQPGVTAETIVRLVDAFRGGRGKIVVPSHGGRRGHPLLLSTSYCDEIRTRYDDVGLRGLLGAHAGDVFTVEVATPGILLDIDEPQDYRRAAAEFHDGDEPPSERDTRGD